jgi:hypothetical protein
LKAKRLEGNGRAELEPQRRRRLQLRPCAQCGEEFRPSSPATRYCGTGCRVAAQHRHAEVRRSRGPNPLEAWPQPVRALAATVERLARELDGSPPARRAVLRQRLMISTAQLDLAQLRVMGTEAPAP